VSGWAENMDTKKIVSLEKHMDSVDIYVNHFSDDSLEPVCPKYSESGNHGCDGIFEAKKI